MSSLERDDYMRFSYALIARDVRRLTAHLYSANLDESLRMQIGAALDQLECRVRSTLMYDPTTGVLIQDQDNYLDGRPVTTTVDWGAGFATLVHCPHPEDGTSGDGAEELSEEVWPDAL